MSKPRHTIQFDGIEEMWEVELANGWQFEGYGDENYGLHYKMVRTRREAREWAKDAVPCTCLRCTNKEG